MGNDNPEELETEYSEESVVDFELYKTLIKNAFEIVHTLDLNLVVEKSFSKIYQSNLIKIVCSEVLITKFLNKHWTLSTDIYVTEILKLINENMFLTKNEEEKEKYEKITDMLMNILET